MPLSGGCCSPNYRFVCVNPRQWGGYKRSIRLIALCFFRQPQVTSRSRFGAECVRQGQLRDVIRSSANRT